MGSLVDEVHAVGGEVAGIAVTPLFSQMAFAEQLGLGFPLLSDWNREVCGRYGVRYDTWKGHDGLAKRALFVVDPAKVVRYVWSDDDAEVLPDLGPVMAAIRSI